MVEGGECAERYGDQIGDEKGEDRQLQRNGQPLQHLGPDRHMILERRAEVAAEHPPEPVEILNMQRAVEPVLMLEASNRLWRGIDTQRRLRRRARERR